VSPAGGVRDLDTLITRRSAKGKAYYAKTIAHGQVVWDLLADNPGGLTMVDLTELSGLTRAQVRKAFEWIRDIFASDQDQPIIYQPGRHRNVYKLAVDPLESEDDVRRRLAVWKLQIRRVRTAITGPSAARWPEHADRFRRLSRHLGVAEEDLNDLLNHTA
jgi:hypothetical protein